GAARDATSWLDATIEPGPPRRRRPVRRLRIVGLLLVALAPHAGAGRAAAGACAPGPAAMVAAQEADWVLAAQDHSGAIRQAPGSRVVNPYLGGFAAVSLARAATVTCEERYLEDAWRWVEWYAAAMDPHGVVPGAVTD